MKILLLATVSLAALLATSAMAADAIEPMAEAPVAASGDADWSGFYAGIYGGAGTFFGLVENNGGDAVDDAPYSVETDGSGFLAGVQAGVNGQSGNLVFGVVGSATWVGFDEAYGYDSGDNYTSAAISGILALQGKLGLAVGNAMVYGTAGVVGVLTEQCATDDDNLGYNPDDRDCDEATYAGVEFSGIQFGGIGGIGAEFKVTDTLSLFGEYNYFATGPVNEEYFVSSGDADFSTSGHIVKLGVNSSF